MSEKKLRSVLDANGITYEHRPDLGVPREIRAKASEAGSLDVIWHWYDENVVASLADVQSFLGEFEQPVALMCTEIDPGECHRHRLALALEGTRLRGFDL